MPGHLWPGAQDAVGLLRTIKAVQRLGFTLTEIEELLDLSAHRRGTGELHQRAQAKVAEIDAKINQLTQMRQTLVAVLATTTEPPRTPPTPRPALAGGLAVVACLGDQSRPVIP